MNALKHQIASCDLCADRFAKTATAHEPGPVVWFSANTRILIAGQAPGARVHASGRPFDDRSGDRLRDWMGVDPAVFYDRSLVSIIPMGFCFPGYDTKGSDLAPPALCRNTWHGPLMQMLPAPDLKLIIGGYAQKFHLGVKTGVTETVKNWRDFGPNIFPLPHPSWRNTGWKKKTRGSRLSSCQTCGAK